MLILIRLPVIFTYFILINLVFLLICVVRPFHKNNVMLGSKMYASMAPLFGVRVKLRVSDKVKKGGPYVYIGNHQNSYDIVTICKATQPGTVTVGKKSLVWIPVMGWMYWLSGNILIDRKNSTKARGTIAQTVAKIRRRGISVWLFPEGTRSYGRGLLPFKTGAFRIAKETKEPVVPICASSLHDKIRLNRWNNGTVLVSVGEPEVVDDSRTLKEWATHFHGQMAHEIQLLDKEVEALDKGR
ncbi:1-acylglycerol-3-phosphate O-acyltransferase [Saliniradius amylolyticus]|uniref:1-acyl-sn-glycerol-3-phosphate acyltransferase n=1 Tax=Saliniradius amylolyticus TaxID=2183582 RepID=A0A2S2E885_9ALTE|nr:1-acylglycerol-3-phosphate O-acyltransferase [Saliniradius amylolyticus]AWL13157.1 1-acylglycerol-3-phosphate O-acyltransferase [Saliniradius amylolyticus]